MHTQPSGSPLLSDAGLYSLACCFYNLPTLKIKPLLLPSPGLRSFPGHPPPWLLGSHQGLSSGQMQPHSSGLGLGSCLCCGTLSPCHPCTIWSSFLRLTGISSSGSRNAFGSGGSSSAVMQENNVTKHSGISFQFWSWFWISSLRAIVYGQTPDTEGSGLEM